MREREGGRGERGRGVFVLPLDPVSPPSSARPFFFSHTSVLSTSSVSFFLACPFFYFFVPFIVPLPFEFLGCTGSLFFL